LVDGETGGLGDVERECRRVWMEGRIEIWKILGVASNFQLPNYGV